MFHTAANISAGGPPRTKGHKVAIRREQMRFDALPYRGNGVKERMRSFLSFSFISFFVFLLSFHP